MEKNRLNWQTIVLHWVVGLSFIGVFGLGLYMVEQPAPEKFELFGIHKSIGTMFLIVALFRLIWRLNEGLPSELSPMRRWQRVAAKAVHWFLLIATIAMPISGIVMNVGGGRALDVFGWEIFAEGQEIKWMQDIGSTIHHLGINFIIAAFLLHVAGAIKHQLIDKDGTISRMLGR